MTKPGTPTLLAEPWPQEPPAEAAPPSQPDSRNGRVKIVTSPRAPASARSSVKTGMGMDLVSLVQRLHGDLDASIHRHSKQLEALLAQRALSTGQRAPSLSDLSLVEDTGFDEGPCSPVSLLEHTEDEAEGRLGGETTMVEEMPASVQHLHRTFQDEEAERERQSRSRTQRKSIVSDAVESACESMDFGRGAAMNTLIGSAESHSTFRAEVKKLVASKAFDIFFCVLILTNTVVFGIEAEYLAQTMMLEAPIEFKIISLVYTALFLVEFVLRVVAYGHSFFCSSDCAWNILDTIIIALSVVELVVFVFESQGITTLAAADQLVYMRMLRIARTARMLRVVRIISFFRALRLLLLSVMNTMKSLFWTVMLLLIILYMFGVMFTQAATQHLAVETEEIVGLSRYYGTLYLSVYTLFKSITNGLDWETAAEPLSELGSFWAFLFIVYIAFTYFAVLNVVTGVFCQTAIESAVKDQDEVMQSVQDRKKAYIDQLTELFNDVDSNGSGDLTIDEFEILLQDERLQKYCASLDITIDDAWALFKLLDKDGSGEICVTEFVTGCLRLQGAARSVDLALAAYQLQWLIDRLERFIQYSDEQFRDLRTAVEVQKSPTRPTSKRPTSTSTVSARGASCDGAAAAGA